MYNLNIQGTNPLIVMSSDLRIGKVSAGFLTVSSHINDFFAPVQICFSADTSK